MASCNQDKLMEYHLHNVEFMIKKLMTECSKKTGKPIDKHTIILDLKGLGFQREFPALDFQIESLFLPAFLTYRS